MKSIFLFLAILAIFPGSVMAQDSLATIQGLPVQSICLNDSYIQSYLSFDFDGVTHEINVSSTYCPHGCVINASTFGDSCYQAQPWAFPIPAAIFTALAFLFFLLFSKADKSIINEDGEFNFVSSIFSYLYFVLGLVFVVLTNWALLRFMQEVYAPAFQFFDTLLALLIPFVFLTAAFYLIGLVIVIAVTVKKMIKIRQEAEA